MENEDNKLTTNMINRVRAASAILKMKKNITPLRVDKKLKVLGISLSFSEIEELLRVLSRNEKLHFNLFNYRVPKGWRMT